MPDDKKLLSYTETSTQFVAPLDISADGEGSITSGGEQVSDQKIGPIDHVTPKDVLINLATLDVHEVVEIMDNGLVVITTKSGHRKVPEAELARHLRKVYYT